MKILIITQKVDVNNDVLGFFHSWLEKFAEQADKVYVVCLFAGEYNLPENVKVYSLGKEKGFSKIRQFFRLEKFLFKRLPEVNGIFCHMCPIYLILSFPLAKIFKKKLVLWYVHRSVNFKLKLAEKLADNIFTASKESCQLKSKKVEILGHGIDTDFFRPGYNLNTTNKIFKILFVGRISPIKDLKTLIKAADILINQKKIPALEFDIVGQPLSNFDKEYFEEVKELVQEKNLNKYVNFLGSIPHKDILKFYQESDIFVNLCPTGGMDKAVLEAMACNTLVLVANQTFRNLLGNLARNLIFEKGNSEDLAQKIYLLINDSDQQESKEHLREIVLREHDLKNLIKKVTLFYVKT